MYMKSTNVAICTTKSDYEYSTALPIRDCHGYMYVK